MIQQLFDFNRFIKVQYSFYEYEHLMLCNGRFRLFQFVEYTVHVHTVLTVHYMYIYSIQYDFVLFNFNTFSYKLILVLLNNSSHSTP